jgi:hypothetical protein
MIYIYILFVFNFICTPPPGDLHLMTELKLANDNLRWRLERQARALSCSSAVIEQLREANAQFAEKEKEKEKEKASACTCTCTCCCRSSTTPRERD